MPHLDEDDRNKATKYDSIKINDPDIQTHVKDILRTALLDV